MDIQRLILFVALGLVSMLLLQNWQAYQADKNPVAAIEQNIQTGVPGVSTPSVAANKDIPTPTAGVPSVSAPANIPVSEATTAKGDLVHVKTDLLDIKIDTLGGSLTYAGLNEYPIDLETPDIPVVLLQNTAEERYLAESGLTGAVGSTLPNHHSQFQAKSLNYDMADADTLEVPLYFTDPSGVEYTKIYTFKRDSYEIGVRFKINNKSSSTWNGNFYGHLLRTEPNKNKSKGILSGRMPSFTGAAYYTPEDLYNKLKFSKMGDKDSELPLESGGGWIAMLQHYFVGAWLPTKDGKYRFYDQSDTRLAKPEYKLGFLDLNGAQIAPGQSAELGADFYIGPKERDRLDAQPVDDLRLTVDFGWLTVIAEPLFWVMRKINALVGNWGWTIILITILIKAMFLPLSAASYKSMAKMKKLSPRLKTLKERYGDDKQKFQGEMMKLYKQEKVNPAGGCLPILVQIPVFISLYWVLLESVELRQAPWAFWIHDISIQDPYFILPVLMGATMLLQQLLNPAPMDPMQQKIMLALPVVFTIFFLSFPAGLVLYWVVNNSLSISQQWLITRRYQ